MKKWSITRRWLCVGLTLLLLLFLAACNGQTNEQDSTPPTASVQPTIAPTPTPEPTPPIPYTDVAEDSPYYDAVVWAYENEITSDGEIFGPADACTRGQVITFLWRALGSPEPWIMENPFIDASPDAWYYKPALWAYQHNIAASTTVNPGNLCTNAEALTLLEGKPGRLNTLAASGAYYAQPVAWADQNGLLAGAEFDPAAPCSHADLMVYLYCAAEQWAPSEEEQRIQTEYDKVLYSSANIPNYADYVDVDGDGKLELLTLERRYDNEEAVAIAVYTDIDGHIEKSCEGIFREPENSPNLPEDTFLTDGGVFSLYSADGQLYLCQNRYFYEIGSYPTEDDLYDFYRIEKEAITFCEQRSIWTMYDRETGEETKGDTGTSRNYTKQKDILRLDQQYFSGRDYLKYSVLDEGILPSWEERGRYWTAYWEASDPMYVAVLNGDFSDFAGTYSPYSDMNLTFNDLTLDKNGILTGDDFILAIKPSSVTVREDGVIYCELATREEGETGHTYEYYEIYPVGVGAEFIMEENYQDNPNIVRIIYKYPTHGADQDLFSKVS